MKLRRSRGLNCWDARVNATTVTENTVPVTVIIDPATVESRARAPSGPPEYRYTTDSIQIRERR